MKIFFALFIICINVNLSFSQLDTIKAYRVTLTHFNINDNEYRINGELISKEEYDRVDSNSVYKYLNLDYPIYLKTFSYSDTILEEGVFYKRNWYSEKRNYSNGKLESIINFTPFNLNKKPIRDGFTYILNLKGDTIYKDLWEKGLFIEEIIPRDHNSVWKINTFIDGENFDDRHTMSIKEWKKLKSIKIIPSYKNDQLIGKDIIIKISLIYAKKIHSPIVLMKPEELENINFKKWKKTIQEKRIIDCRLLIVVEQLTNKKLDTLLVKNIIFKN